MYRFRNRWRRLYAKRAKASTDRERDEIDKQLASLVRGMKQDFSRLLGFLAQQGMVLRDHYEGVRAIVDTIAAKT